MREHKYRVWDGEQMWYPETLTADKSNTILRFYNPGRGIRWGLYDARYDNRLASGEYHKLMEFTGLKDKNEREIYEGDVLSHKFYSDPVQVTFKDGSFIAEDVSLFSNSIKIIGHIYETLNS